MLVAQMAFCRAPAGAASRPGRWGHLTADLLLEVAWLLADADVQARSSPGSFDQLQLAASLHAML